jgi:hypothetical protein
MSEAAGKLADEGKIDRDLLQNLNQKKADKL